MQTVYILLTKMPVGEVGQLRFGEEYNSGENSMAEYERIILCIVCIIMMHGCELEDLKAEMHTMHIRLNEASFALTVSHLPVLCIHIYRARVFIYYAFTDWH